MEIHGDLYFLLGSALFFPLHYNDSILYDKLIPIINSLTPAFEQRILTDFQVVHVQLPGVLRFSLLQSILDITQSDHDGLLRSLISATHFSILSNYREFAGLDEVEKKGRMRSSHSTILPQAQQKTGLLLGPDETHAFMRYWAENGFNPFRDSECISMMRISYKSSAGEFLMITTYSPLSSMEITSTSQITERDLIRRLNYLLHSVFQFRNVVTFFSDSIEVKVEIDKVSSNLLYPTLMEEYSLRIERPFPSKISIRIGPENGCVVQSVSLPRSSQNSYKVAFEARKKVGVKASVASSTTVEARNWGFEQSVIEESSAKVDWTLYDISTGKRVFEKGPPKFSLLGPKTWHSKASRAFTEKGGVVFANDEYGDPITWRLNRDLEGQTLKWTVKGSVWLTYWPEQRLTRAFETKRHDFSQEFDLELVQPSAPHPCELFHHQGSPH